MKPQNQSQKLQRIRFGILFISNIARLIWLFKNVTVFINQGEKESLTQKSCILFFFETFSNNRLDPVKQWKRNQSLLLFWYINQCVFVSAEIFYCCCCFITCGFLTIQTTPLNALTQSGAIIAKTPVLSKRTEHSWLLR